MKRLFDIFTDPSSIVTASDWIWGYPLLLMLVGGGLFFLLYSRGTPFFRMSHALAVITGRLDKKDDAGEISHFKALSVALAATIGMGNVAAIAVAVKFGGPGVVFWMWIAAIIGMATKYFTCSLAVMYRGKDRAGNIQGGPMYVIENGLGSKWKWLAIWFAGAGLIGCLPLFTVNQLTEATRDIPVAAIGITDLSGSSLFWTNIAIGGGLAALTAVVVFGGLQRLAAFVSALVPAMVVLYTLGVLGIIVLNISDVGGVFASIFSDAFQARNIADEEKVWGGALGALIILGARRATFSNEAGIGTAPMAHGAAKTSEPVHEGLVAMMGPVIDTLLVCTMTSLALLLTGVWETSDGNGVAITADAFRAAYSGFGAYLLYICVVFFGLSSLLSYAYFGSKCFGYLFHSKYTPIYLTIYVGSIFIAAAAQLGIILSLIDLMFALMAIPTVISALLLSPKVVRETKRYFSARSAH